jgi:sugar lactone lactonase YvrE
LTPADYGWYNGIAENAPQLKAASYRFRPSTGQVSIVDESMGEPKGIAISPNGKHVYISDTAAVSGTLDRQYPNQQMTFNMTKERTVYKFDVVDNGNAISGKRPIGRSPDGIPDGLRVAANGYVLTATGGGVDVLDEYGSLILRIQAGLPVQ